MYAGTIGLPRDFSGVRALLETCRVELVPSRDRLAGGDPDEPELRLTRVAGRLDAVASALDDVADSLGTAMASLAGQETLAREADRRIKNNLQVVNGGSGLRFVKLLADQAQAQLTIERCGGTRITLCLPERAT